MSKLFFCLSSSLLVIAGVAIFAAAKEGEPDLNWPTYGRDDQRSGQYPIDFELPLYPAWVHFPQHPPKPAWPATAPTDFWRNRTTPEKSLIDFDHAYQIVAADERVLYATSADDQVVCLQLQDGKELWRFFAEGPIRLAPTISGDRVVFGCDDGFIYCLKLATGELIWRQAAAKEPGKRIPGNGRIVGQHPVRSGVLIRDGLVYYAAGLFPKQNVWHGVISLETGEFLTAKSVNASVQGYLREQDGKLFVPTGRHPAGLFLQQLKRRGKIEQQAAANISRQYPYAFIATPNLRFAGGDNEVVALRGDSGEIVWKAKVTGRVLGLAIANGVLLASTDTGATYAFRSQEEKSLPTSKPPTPKELQPNSLATKAKELLGKAGRRRGYALVVGDAKGELTRELARQSQLQIIGVGLSAATMSRQRQSLAAEGLYGQVVLHDVSLVDLPYRKSIFNAVIIAADSNLLANDSRLLPLLRPGGKLIAGDAVKTSPPRKGAGSWSHLYGHAGNTACSFDAVATDKLTLQWFGEPGPQNIIDRHLRAMAPVARDGLLFVPGNDYLYGVDAFNGTILWEKPIENFRRIGVLRGSGSLAVGEESLFAATGDHCLVLNRETGEEKSRIALPAADQPQEWGYLAAYNETVIGSAVGKGGVYRTFSREAIYGAGYGDNTKITVSTTLFANDAVSGERLWKHLPAGVIFDPSIAVSNSSVYFLESRNEKTRSESRSHYPELLNAKGGDLVALNRTTGKEQWRIDFESPKGIQTLFLLCTDNEIVVGFSRNTIAEGATKPTVHYETRVYETTGKLRWRQAFDTKKRPNLDHGEQDRHPAIVGSQVVIEPNIYSLANGKVIDTFKRGYGCGTLSASANHLFFRSGNPASYSLETGKITPLNSVSRPGCWINVITSDGLVLLPEGSSGCVCKFPLQCSMAYSPD